MPKFKTVRFGDLEYRQEDVLLMPGGLVGMPHLRNWLLMDMGGDHAIKWFQSLDRGDFGFPVVHPALFLEDYQFDLNKDCRTRIGNSCEEEIAVMIITTVHAGGEKVTGNMVAPLVFDMVTRKGLQLTLDGDFSMRQEINYFKFGLAVNVGTVENEASLENLEAAVAAGQSDQGMSEATGAQQVARDPVPV